MKMYKDDLCCDVDKEQRDILLGAGWSKEPPVVKTEEVVEESQEEKPSPRRKTK